jgi:hypothetical protein
MSNTFVPRERLQGSAFGAERAMWDATLERGMVDLRHKQILARVDVLNSMNTQAMLVAGAAVASMGGESLQTLDDADTWLVWHRVLGSSFVLTAAFTTAASLWVIVVSSNLIMLSQQSVLQGASSEEISSTDAILSAKVEDVRIFYTASIASLLISSLLMVWINQTFLNSAITTVTFYAFARFAVTHISHTHDEFARQTSLQPHDSQSPTSRLLSLCVQEILPSLVPCWSVSSAADATAGSRSLPLSSGSARGYSQLDEPSNNAPRGERQDPVDWVAPAAAPEGLRPPASSSTATAVPNRRQTAPPIPEERRLSPMGMGASIPPRGRANTAMTPRSLALSSREVVLQGWLRKAPSMRLDAKQQTLLFRPPSGGGPPSWWPAGVPTAAGGSAGESLPTLPISTQQDRYFVMRADASLSYYRAMEEFDLDLEPRATLSLPKLEVHRARDAKGALLLVLVQHQVDPNNSNSRNSGGAASGGGGGGGGHAASPPDATASVQRPRGVSGGGIARGIASLFTSSDPKAWCIQGKDDGETSAWMLRIEAAAAAPGVGGEPGVHGQGQAGAGGAAEVGTEAQAEGAQVAAGAAQSP